MLAGLLQDGTEDDERNIENGNNQIERLVSREKCHISVSLVCHREKNEVG